MSKIRKSYFFRFITRILIFGYILYKYFTDITYFDLVIDWNMFAHFSFLHILFLLWVFDMLWQLIPSGWHVALGSQKLFLKRFREKKVDVSDIAGGIKKGVENTQKELKKTIEKSKENISKINYESLKDYIKTTTKQAYKVFAVWMFLLLIVAVVYFMGIVTYRELFVLTVFLYVVDLFCVLIWCPFRLIMKNKCCTTCRIFNWDHAMMFSAFIFMPGLYTVLLLLMSIAVWIYWEVHVMIHPERFWEITNISLRCSECTDKLCTQYCQKLRKR